SSSLYSITIYSFFFFTSSRAHPHPHSFPTRRSSDLGAVRAHTDDERPCAKSTTQIANHSVLNRVRGSSAGTQRNRTRPRRSPPRSEEHTSELQSRGHLVCRLLLEKKKKTNIQQHTER